MARTVTRAQLRTRARQKSNMENALAPWPDADVNERIDTRTCELWDLLVQAAPPDYYSTSTNISVVAGTISYALPSDFKDLQEVYVQGTSTDRLRALLPMRRGERGQLQAPTSANTVVIEYTPNFTTFTADSGAGGQLDGVNGWDDLVVALVARDMLVKLRESTEQVDQEIAELRARIMKLSVRDKGNPAHVRDVEDDDENVFWDVTDTLTRYRLRGSNIEIYETGVWG